jgi:D-3-phosphoglycerate dehydrogenase
MISLLRHLTEADRSVKDGKWEKKKFEGRELFGKTLGLVGSGRIGADVAKRAQAFGMRVIAYDPYLSPPTAKALGIQLVDKDVVFREADVVSVHAALTPETKGMIAAAEFAMMKRGAILVNCARAEIVQENEPPVGSPLLSAPNAVFTPHLGASTHEAQARAGSIIADQVIKVLDGRRPEFLVNPDVYG